MVEVTMKTALKRCPFCGSIPQISRTTKAVGAIDAPVLLIQTRVKIKCEKCFLTKDVMATSVGDLNLDKKAINSISRFDAKRAINNFWNVRVDNA